MQWRRLMKSKVFWSGIGSIISAVIGYYTGEIDLSAAVSVTVLSVVGIFGRDTAAKIENKLDVINDREDEKLRDRI